MILDSQTRFSDAQSVASAAGDVVSTDIYDTGAAADVGIGQEEMLQIQVNEAVVGAGASVQFVLQTSAASNFSAPVEFPLTAAVPVASLTANSLQYRGRLPIGLLRYLRIVYRVTGATTTDGTVTAFLANDLQIAPALPTTVPGVK
jgi:hypothetical protein